MLRRKGVAALLSLVAVRARGRLLRVLLGGLILAGCGGGGGAGGACSAQGDFFRCGGPFNIAHRGGALLAPENTLEAFENALTVGADILETDVHVTEDMVPVCLHDGDVSRTTDGVGHVGGYTAQELGHLDAGYRFTPDAGASFPFRGRGVRIPTLAEALERFPDTRFSVEVKQPAPAVIDAVLAVIRGARAFDRVVIASGHDAILARARRLESRAVTALGGVEVEAFVDLRTEDEAAYSPPGAVLQIRFDRVDAGIVEKAHRVGMAVQAYTVNDRDDARALLDLGVDGVMSDDPVMMEDLLGELQLRGSASPRSTFDTTVR